MADAFERAMAAGKAAWGSDWRPERVSRAPGRLELLGNHIDYNGGPVLAAAIDRECVCLVSASPWPGIDVLMADVAHGPVHLEPNELTDWRNTTGSIEPLDYVRGVIATGLDTDGDVSVGIRIVAVGDVPQGFGLSSSAALCVALTMALHTSSPIERELVLRAQDAEHRAGAPCGTMDQSASVGGEVILFNGGSTTWVSVTPRLADFVFAVADSGVHRSLGASSYPKRVQESQEALRILNASGIVNYSSLARIDVDGLDTVEGLLPEALFHRARHVATETERVFAGVDAIDGRDWERFGDLMNSSGESSAGDYAISHPRVEELVAIARSVDGVAGARMMGGGEGGVALILCRREAIDRLKSALQAGYYARWPSEQAEPVRVFQFAPGASVREMGTAR